VDRPGTALLRARWGFLRGLRALPRDDTWPHVLEFPIRFQGAILGLMCLNFLSVRMNITMGRDISDDKIFDLIANIGWDDLISNWNQNLGTKILENGRDLSGGQKQKIVLLRALVNEPPILLLDEPEKNLDNHSLIKLTEYLVKIKERCTIILVSHSNVFKDVIDQKIQIT